MDNEEGSQTHWQEQAQEAWDNADGLSANAKLTGKEIFTREEKAVIQLSAQLQAEHEEAMQDMLDQGNMSASMWADLLGGALSEVNWREIAQSLMATVNKSEVSDQA